MTFNSGSPVISVMLAVADAPAAVEWYQRALGASLLWSLGSVAGLQLGETQFFVAEPANNDWETPARIGTTTCRIEVFSDEPDEIIRRAVEAGATERDPIRDHQRPWGLHRQGVFVDPFGHLWFVGDKSPLKRSP